jgi:hypothetical protein
MEHGTPFRFAPRKGDGGSYRYCLDCRRERENERKGYRALDDEWCRKRRHRKTPWSWRFSVTRWYCYSCEMERRRERRESA